MNSEKGTVLDKPLTPREKEYLALLGEELSNPQIAERLTVALSTVKWTLRQVFAKLGAKNRKDAIIIARKMGLLTDPARLARQRYQLPPEPNAFIGRTAELTILNELIAKPAVRLITVTGAGGMGKTRLALALAHQIVANNHQFVDGVVFVPLAAIDSVESLIPAVAAALNLTLEGAENRTPERQIIDYLRRKRLLIVLDNYEQLLPDIQLIASFLQTAPDLKILVTSRERLQLQEEHCLPLTGLTYPDWKTPKAQTSERLDDFTAFELFTAVAQRLQPNYQLTTANISTLTQMCRLVEGMPLALELAAGWLDVLSLEEILIELQQNVGLLETKFRNVPARHRHVFAAFESTWRRLTQQEQSIFASMSLFRGGFIREAAHQVCAAEMSLPAFLRVLSTLMSKSLLRHQLETDRYDLHELLRQFGNKKLEGSDQAHDLHSAYFLNQLHTLESELKGGKQQVALTKIKTDLDNIRRAWEWAIDQAHYRQIADAIDSLGLFFFILAQYYAGEQLFRAAADKLQIVIQEDQAKTDQTLLQAARLLTWQSRFILFTHSAEEAIRLTEKSLFFLDHPILADQDVLKEKAFSLLARGDAALMLGSLKEARTDFRQSLALYRQVQDLAGVATVLYYLGELVTNSKEYSLARQYLKESLATYQKCGDQFGMAQVWNCLAENTRYGGGGAEGAMHFYDQALAEFEIKENHWGTRYMLAQKGYLAFSIGQFEKAVQCLEQCKDIDQTTGNYHGTIFTVLGAAYWYSGNLEKGYSLLKKGVVTFKEKGSFRRLFWAKANVAIVDAFSGKYEQARLQAEEILSQTAGSERISSRAYALLALSWVGLVRGRFDETVAWLEECALTLKQPTASRAAPESLGWAWVILGGALYGLGRCEESRQQLYRALKSGVTRRSFITLLYLIPVVSVVLAGDGDKEQKVRAVELYAMANSHPFIDNSQLFEDIAGRTLSAVKVSLPSEVVAAAEVRGKGLDWWETAVTLLNELAELGWSEPQLPYVAITGTS